MRTSSGRGLSAPLRIVIATRNRAKAREMARILADRRWILLTLDDLAEPGPEVEETGRTYSDNALLKARAAMQASGLIAIADDAGLEIDALDGQPGVHSHRFLGADTPFPDKMTRILRLLDGVPDEGRGCRFRAAVAICAPDGTEHICTGVCEGMIGREQRGAGGFGYDPIFALPALGRHMAELSAAEKDRISHRGQALACARAVLESIAL